MTNYHSTAPILLVAIDISKHRHEVLVGIPSKKRRRRMIILNTLSGNRCGLTQSWPTQNFIFTPSGQHFSWFSILSEGTEEG